MYLRSFLRNIKVIELWILAQLLVCLLLTHLPIFNANALDIQNRHFSLWLSTDSKLMIDSKVSGASQKVYIEDINVGSGTFYKLEITQSLIIDKVRFF